MPAINIGTTTRTSCTPGTPNHWRLAGLTVLAVEDEELNRMVLREMLEYEGATVVLTENGRQALDRLEEFGPAAFDIVIMGMQMPVMDGYKTFNGG